MTKTGLKRHSRDEFYTIPSTAKLCMKLFIRSIRIRKNDLIIEPSAGNGAFIKYIKIIADNYLFYDIYPEHEEIIKADFLNIDILHNRRIHILGNPPFGRQSSLAIKFIKKASEFADTIAFILPKSFKKESMKRHFPLNFHLIAECDLPADSFMIDGAPHNVPCAFQIWKRKNYERDAEEKIPPAGYKFVKKNQPADISFRRVGVNAGKIDTNLNKSEQSHYFIKFDYEVNIEKLKTIVYEFNNTVGPKSISKQELIKKFNQALK